MAGTKKASGSSVTPKKKDLQELIEMKERMESQETALAVSQAQVTNPSREVEESLTNFVVSRLEKLKSNDDFEDLIRMHLRQRIPEASFDQLIELMDKTAQRNNAATEVLVPLFVNESSGKTVIDTLKDSSVSSTAQNLYASADKDMLQAISYLSSVMSKIGGQVPPPDVEVQDSTN